MWLCWQVTEWWLCQWRYAVWLSVGLTVDLRHFQLTRRPLPLNWTLLLLSQLHCRSTTCHTSSLSRSATPPQSCSHAAVLCCSLLLIVTHSHECSVFDSLSIWQQIYWLNKKMCGRDGCCNTRPCWLIDLKLHGDMFRWRSAVRGRLKLLVNYTVSRKCTNFERLQLKIERINFDEIWHKYSKDSRI